jgi:hypothetical protein
MGAPGDGVLRSPLGRVGIGSTVTSTASGTSRGRWRWKRKGNLEFRVEAPKPPRSTPTTRDRPGSSPPDSRQPGNPPPPASARRPIDDTQGPNVLPRQTASKPARRRGELPLARRTPEQTLPADLDEYAQPLTPLFAGPFGGDYLTRRAPERSRPPGRRSPAGSLDTRTRPLDTHSSSSSTPTAVPG